jgi:hypothetical protein
MSDAHDPPAFADKLGRTWTLEPRLELFQAVKATAGVDLLDIATTRKCLEQLEDPYTLAAALEVATEPERVKRGMSREQYLDGVDGDMLDRGQKALEDAAIFFSRKSRRMWLRTVVDTAREAERKMEANLAGRLDEIATRTRLYLEQLATSSANATSSPASSASTPDPGACGPSTGPRRRSSRKAGSTPAPS